MEIQYAEQKGARRSTWIEFEPAINGASLELPAHSVWVRGIEYPLPVETLEIQEGHLFLDGDGEYHFRAPEFMEDVEIKPIPGVGGPVTLLWVRGETITVLRSVE